MPVQNMHNYTENGHLARINAISAHLTGMIHS